MAGQLSPAIDYATGRIKAIIRGAVRSQPYVFNTGFASLSDLIAKAGQGRRNVFNFNKAGQIGTTGGSSSLWFAGSNPPAGNVPSAAPGGDALTSASTGVFGLVNAISGETQHFVRAELRSDQINGLLLYDRLFQVAKALASTATEAVTGVPTRYQSTTATDPDYAGGNFLFVEVGSTGLAATAHNWTVCTYKDQAGGASTLPSLAGVSGQNQQRFDHPTGQWFAPLAAGDIGVQTLTQMQCDASVATGTINFVIGHPIAFMPCPIVGLTCINDGVNTAFSLVRIFDNAALAFIEPLRMTGGSTTTYVGTFETVCG